MANKQEKFDIVIIGAGVVGLAIAAELSTRKPASSIVLIEKNETFGSETSSRNSEVIHAGIYYPTDSLKARLCVEGRALLYQFCEKWGINHNRCGKLVVANSPEESASLNDLHSRALVNGVVDLELIGSARVRKIEPNIKAADALLSPSTGVVDSHGLMVRLEQIALQNGVLFAYCHRASDLEKLSSGFRLHLVNPDGSADLIDTDYLINCAGLQADQIAAMAGIDITTALYRQHLCKGEYFSLPPAKGALVKRLIYPPPLHELTGLGIHVTKTLDGRLRLGPNTIYTEVEDYSVNPAHAADFFAAVKTFLPFVEPADIEPEMAGIRPKLSGPGESFRDFIIREETDRGLPGLVNLVGIESPGLTCCLSIARLVHKIIFEQV